MRCATLACSLTIRAGERYSIAGILLRPDIEVTSADRALHLAGGARVGQQRVLRRLPMTPRRQHPPEEEVSAPVIRLGLTGLGAATALSRAIRERRVVCFRISGVGGVDGACGGAVGAVRAGAGAVPVGVGP